MKNVIFIILQNKEDTSLENGRNVSCGADGGNIDL